MDEIYLRRGWRQLEWTSCTGDVKGEEQSLKLFKLPSNFVKLVLLLLQKGLIPGAYTVSGQIFKITFLYIYYVLIINLVQLPTGWENVESGEKNGWSVFVG